jgi:hypothetical protein
MGRWPGSWLWPTPRADKGNSQGTEAVRAYAEAGFVQPTTRNGKTRGKGRTFDTSLGTAVAAREMWPTPTANNYESEPEVFLPRREREKAKGRNGNGFGLTLGMAVKLWPTPQASDASGGRIEHEWGGTRPSGSKRSNSLATATKMWPMPIARDKRTFLGAQRSPNAQGGEPLTVQVGGTLNPAWVEWLMGFPPGWTDLDA